LNDACRDHASSFRDLGSQDLWEQSLRRSRARRAAAAERRELPHPSPRSASVAAVIALAGATGATFGSATIATPDSAQAAAKVQSRGGGVAELQRALGIPADGVFGRQTQRAVKRFQRRRGLTADGIAGPATRSALGMGPGRMLKRKRGSSGTNAGGGRGTDAIIRRMVAAGNRIARKPYLYGGGHGSFNDSGYDCSGSVSYVLHAAGLLSSPRASGGFTSYGDAGPGRRVSIYANSGHMYMTIDGRRFDTSARSSTGTRWSSESRSSSGFVVRHPPGL
jgi:cell wall-associated NlpC family hydrolase